MTRADDLVAAWRLYRLLRAWRDGSLASGSELADQEPT